MKKSTKIIIAIAIIIAVIICGVVGYVVSVSVVNKAIDSGMEGISRIAEENKAEQGEETSQDALAEITEDTTTG